MNYKSLGSADCTSPLQRTNKLLPYIIHWVNHWVSRMVVQDTKDFMGYPFYACLRIMNQTLTKLLILFPVMMTNETYQEGMMSV